MYSNVCVSLSYDTRNVFSLFSMINTRAHARWTRNNRFGRFDLLTEQSEQFIYFLALKN